MRTFLLRVLIFFLPLAAGMVLLELLIRNIPNDYSFKNSFLETRGRETEVLFLGSSRTYYGIIPELAAENGFNAGHISQSIDYDAALFFKFLPRLNNLKVVVVPVDHFTLFRQLTQGPEKWRQKNYEIYYGIDRSSKPRENSEVLSLPFLVNLERVWKHLLKGENEVTCSPTGYGIVPQPARDLEESGKRAAGRHNSATNEYLFSNVAALHRIIETAGTKNITVLLTGFPVYETYRRHLDRAQTTKNQAIINHALRKYPNVVYLDFSSDPAFTAGHFRDADHLNREGAELFSRKLSGELDQIMGKFSE